MNKAKLKDRFSDFTLFTLFIPFCLKYREEKLNKDRWCILDKILSSKTNIAKYNVDKLIPTYLYDEEINESNKSSNEKKEEDKLILNGTLTSHEIFFLVETLNEEMGFIADSLNEFKSKRSKSEGGTLQEKEQYNQYLEFMTKCASKSYLPIAVSLLGQQVEQYKDKVIKESITRREHFKIWFGEHSEKIWEMSSESIKARTVAVEVILGVSTKGKNRADWIKTVLGDNFQSDLNKMTEVDVLLEWTMWYVVFDYLNNQNIDFYEYFYKEFKIWIEIFKADLLENKTIKLKPSLKDVRQIEKGEMLCVLYKQMDNRKLSEDKRNKLTCKFICEMRRLCKQQKTTPTLLYSSLLELDEIMKDMKGLEKKIRGRVSSLEEMKNKETIIQYNKKNKINDTAQIIYVHAIEIIHDFNPSISEGHFYKYFRKKVGGKTFATYRNQMRKTIDRGRITYDEEVRYDDDSDGEEEHNPVIDMLAGLIDIKKMHENRDTIRQINSILESKLTLQEKEVMTKEMVYIKESYKTKERNKKIAEELNISVGNVRILKMRALKKLKANYIS